MECSNVCPKATHKAKYFHCDIHESNILKFGEEYQLIDYDHAVEQTEPTVVFRKGAQYDCGGSSLRNKKVDDSVTWECFDGIEMAASVVNSSRCLQNAVSTLKQSSSGGKSTCPFILSIVDLEVLLCTPVQPTYS